MLSLDHNMRLFAFLSVLSVFYIFVGCNPQWHIERASKHVKKAEEKGAVIEKDTIYVSGDTVVNTYWKDSVLYIDRIITNTEYIQGEIRYITKKDKRIARRKERRNDKYRFKLQKQELKTELKKSKRSNWFWRGLLTGLILTLVVNLLWKKYLRFFVRK